jgi:hypothetical protein
MTLSVETSRACGHLADIDGESPDGSAADAARREVRHNAQILANTTRLAIEIYAQHPRAQDWVVDVVEAE